MSLSDLALSGPREGRTVTSGHGSSAELKFAAEQPGGDGGAVEWHLHAGDEPPIDIHGREDEPLSVLDGAITALVDQRIEVDEHRASGFPRTFPRPERVRRSCFGLILHGPAMAA